MSKEECIDAPLVAGEGPRWAIEMVRNEVTKMQTTLSLSEKRYDEICAKMKRMQNAELKISQNEAKAMLIGGAFAEFAEMVAPF
jgi:hypothetical protein